LQSKRPRAQVIYEEPSAGVSDASLSDYQPSKDETAESPSKRRKSAVSTDTATRCLQAAKAVAAAKPQLAGVSEVPGVSGTRKASDVAGVSEVSRLVKEEPLELPTTSNESGPGGLGVLASAGEEAGGGFVPEEDGVIEEEAEALYSGGGFVPEEEGGGEETDGAGEDAGTGEEMREGSKEGPSGGGQNGAQVDDSVLQLTSDPSDFATRLEEPAGQLEGGLSKPGGRSFLTPLKRKKQVRFQEDAGKPEAKAPKPSLYLTAVKRFENRSAGGPVSGGDDHSVGGSVAEPAATGPASSIQRPGGPVQGMVWINRGPVLNLWVAVVAVRQGFTFEEGLSFGKAVTTMYAQTKGRRLGIIKGAGEAQEAEMEGVELFRVFNTELPARRVKDGLQAVSENKLLAPGPIKAFLSKAFAHNWELARSAMEMLADAYEAEELGAECYNLYVRFRPNIQDGVKGWGQKGLLDLSFISGMLVREKQERDQARLAQ
jgi:hypothetical protein